MGELRISDAHEPAIAWLDLPISNTPPASPARALAESCAPTPVGLRDPFPHGLLRTTPLKGPCGFGADDSSVVERALLSAPVFSRSLKEI